MRQARHTHRRRVTQAQSASSGSIGRLVVGLVAATLLAPWPAAPFAALDSPINLPPLVVPADAEAIPVPADLQVPLILKVLAFDRNFDKRGWTVLRIGIVFVASDPASAKVRSDIVEVFHRLSDKTLRNLPIDYTAVEYTSDAQIEGVVKARQFAMLYIAPGNARNLQKLLQVCQDQHIITTTGVPAYVEKGVAIGIGVRQDRPEIVINLRSMRSAGSEFDASLLQAARVIR